MHNGHTAHNANQATTADAVVLITHTYPTKGVTEATFIKPEIKFLSQSFQRVIIIPLQCNGEPGTFKQQNVHIDLSIANHHFTRHKLTKAPLLFSSFVLKNLKATYLGSNGLRQFLSRCAFCISTEAFAKMISKIITKHRLSPQNTLFYTYWFDYPTTALAYISTSTPLKIISRAHGYDIFETFGYNRPRHLRTFTLRHLLKLYPASQNGSHYLNKIYPGFSNKITTAYLGSLKDYVHTIALCNNSDKFTFLSVARVAPEKNVTGNLEFVIEIAHRFPHKQIKWIHIGDGAKMPSLRERISHISSPGNLSIDLRGEMPNHYVHTIYRTECIDWFLHFSNSEGGVPISICEALSYGVPVIATDVGGIPEIVTSDVGILVSSSTPPDKIANFAMPYFTVAGNYAQLKINAHARWEQLFCATSLRPAFVSEIAQLSQPV